MIKARNNYIRLVDLNCYRLQHLDLSNNFIDKMPALSPMPHLQTLILESNNIKHFKLAISPMNYNSITQFDVSQNKIVMSQH